MTIRAARGEDVAELDAEIASAGVEDTMQWVVDMARADAALSARRDADAAALAREALATGMTEANEPLIRACLAAALLLQGKASDARVAADELRDGVFQGRVSKAFQAVADGGALALEGRPAEARRRFAEGLGELRQLEQLFDRARWQLVAVTLLPDAPEAPTWAAEARELFQRLGAAPFIERLEAVHIGAGSASTDVSRAAAEVATEPS
jgi:hypothetical protein